MTRFGLKASVLIAAVLLAAVHASAATWTVDASHSSAQFSVRHMMVSTVRGEFAKVSGSVELDENNLAPVQISYLTNQVQAFENALFGPNYRDPATGYAAYIDTGSWIDHHWLYTFSKNPDAFRLSAYMFKDRGGPINAGPAWDFDRSLDSYDTRDDAWNTWIPPSGTDYFKYGWWSRLFEDPDFRQRHTDRWQALRRTTLATIQSRSP